MDRQIILIAHNLRSTHNVGSVLRTADGLGVEKVFMTGYTPWPQEPSDDRLPHLARKISQQIHKTALGAENTVAWQHAENIYQLIEDLRQKGWHIYALEQVKHAKSLTSFVPPKRTALVLGREVEGLEQEVVALCDAALYIPMLGQKESFNVAQAAAMSLYHVRFAILPRENEKIKDPGR